MPKTEEGREQAMSETAKCPTCGYTEFDAKFHMDHHLCANAGKAPWEVPVPSAPPSTPAAPLTSVPLSEAMQAKLREKMDDIQDGVAAVPQGEPPADKCTCDERAAQVCRDMPEIAPSYCRVKAERQGEPSAREWTHRHGLLLNPDGLIVAAIGPSPLSAIKRPGWYEEEIQSLIGAASHAQQLPCCGEDMGRLRRERDEMERDANVCLAAAHRAGIVISQQPYAEYAAVPFGATLEFRNERAETAERQLREQAGEVTHWKSRFQDVVNKWCGATAQLREQAVELEAARRRIAELESNDKTNR